MRGSRRKILLSLPFFLAAAAGALFMALKPRAVLDLFREPPPNVLLISIDTLRADHVGAYGYPHPTTPFIDQLAREGVRFEVARSPSSWTAPSLATLLTGVLPHVHGVERGVVSDGEVETQEPLPEALETLAESLSAAGYRTYGITANPHASGSLGFDAGFDDYRTLPFVELARLRPEWESLSARILHEDEEGLRPRFVFVHLFDPHTPYLPYGSYLDAEWPGGEERHDELSSVLVAQELDERDLTEAEHRYLITLYDSEIRRTDDFIREIHRRLGGSERTVTILVSDHGEQFGEHGFHGHSQHLYEGSVRIPFILHDPERFTEPRVVAQPVSLTDVVPTVLELLELPPPKRSDGVSLVAMAEGGRTLRRALFGSLRRFEDLHMTVVGDLKLIEERSAGWSLLFDLAEDPGEIHDLSEERPADVETLRSARSYYLELNERVAPHAAVPLSPEERERLEALGYVE